MELNSDKIRIEDLVSLKKIGTLKPNPEYQRGPVWTEVQQKKLIDSVLRGYPLPLFYLHFKHTNIGGYSNEYLEIIDGQQRTNALEAFHGGGMKLFDPIKDDKIARFPNFIKDVPCRWANKTFDGLDDDLKQKFLNTELFIVKITTENEDEARDLFIRLQAGLPLNPQEKRDAWPGGFTDFILKLGGKKSNHIKYPGHEFFQHLVEKKSIDRGATRTLCAQMAMLYFEKSTENNWTDIGSQKIDDYYYKNLSFDGTSISTKNFREVLNKTYDLLKDKKRKPLRSHEAIHLILIVASLSDDYVKSWESTFADSFDKFREHAAQGKLDKKNNVISDYWYEYGAWTQTSSDQAEFIAKRHNYFTKKMFEYIKPQLKDPTRIYGHIERELIYYRDKKSCPVCETEIKWSDLEIHHVEEHQHGGATSIDNGVPVHKECHPKGQAATIFYEKWKNKREVQNFEAKR